jgi:iron complex outermembrane receptor protein
VHADFGAVGTALGNIGAALTGGNAPSATELQAITPLQVADGVYAYVQGEFSHTSEIILDGSNDPFAIQESCNVVNLRFFINFEQADVGVVV